MTARHRCRPEDAIQRAVFQHLRARGAPNVFAFHPANGGYRKPVEAAILKSLGVVAGVHLGHPAGARVMSIQIDAFINEITRCFGASPASVVLRRGETKMEYDNTNRGALFRNDDKDQNDDKDRDYSGTLDVEGNEYWISGWVRTSKNGKKYLSLSVKPKQDKPSASKKPRADDFGDSIPF